ncbi:transcriptional regulatory protein LEU3 [Pseudovirgaria hyperparasitica]|uniref:Transcriptional regulatory protein LEU3 n=1 Tax=Pseudovirgaria hyperparasitica TaxID=470096 RepID=A0A6A6VZY0_9PEZI|nr:transcriptional regulatory protein LEU3 [Pseudovirgaria hyperparasitica]KAF2755449.1 transcriptional regulatory protein LEU3 [Pseudovirgaria hyperparasitica]
MDGSGRRLKLMKRARKACTECRQQKAKCDAYLNQDGPCTRCGKMKIQCVISDPFKREHKRKRLSELEKETEALKQQLGNTRGSAELTSPRTQTFSSGASASPLGPPTFQPPVANQVSLDYNSGPLHTNRYPIHTPVHTPDQLARGTYDQTLDGTKVSGNTLDEIFMMYFDHYHRFLKILDPSVPPNAYFMESPLLFWAVIGTACRTYTKDLSLLYSLAPKVVSLALTTLQKQPTIQTVKALLLLLTWPFPKGVYDSDVAYPMAGALLHIAMQIGLHIPASSQDFSRVKLRLTEAEVDDRCGIWARVVIVYHRCAAFVGQNPMTILDKSHDPEQVSHLTARLSPSLNYGLTLHRIEARCCDALLENGLRKLPPERELTLDILLRVFEGQLHDVEHQAPTELTRVNWAISRLTILVFHFYKEPNVKEAPAFTRIYNSACQVIELINGMDKNNPGTLAYAPRHLTFGILLAATSILRLLKSWFARYLDVDVARQKLFFSLDMAKLLSHGNKDAQTKLIPVVTQLWSSDKAFKKPDGSEFSALRIRSRLIMSPIADTLWWWREEFGGQAGAYPLTNEDECKKNAPIQCTSGNAIPTADTGSTLLEANPALTTFDWMQPYYFMDDQLLAEFGFNLDNPSAGVSSMDNSYGAWPATPALNGYNMNTAG